MANDNLKNAKREKNDEFYTRLCDIEDELKHYKSQLKGKVIFCNCDDPEESNFWKYFKLNFEHLGLKKLVATHFEREKPSYKLEYDGELIEKSVLRENGDFRSPEAIRILEESDIIVTNPPFSLFREYVGQLMEYDKKFLIIGNQNAVTYKDIFKFMKDNQLWFGYKIGAFKFEVPSHYVTGNLEVGADGKKYAKFGNIAWYTNLETTKRHENLILYKPYSEAAYPKYDNYDAINVDKVAEIPVDYFGVMGVPITFLDKYNPEQFEILGITQRNDDDYKIKRYNKEDYSNANDLNARGVIIVDGKPKSIYARILIKLKEAHQ